MSSEDMRLIDVVAGVDVGHGFRLAWSIGAGGDAWPILVDDRQTGPMAIPHQARHFRAIAPHELGGRMPDEFQQFRCAGRTSGGRPCRTVVPGLGQRCHHHPVELEARNQTEQAAPAPTAPATERQGPRRRRSGGGAGVEGHPTLFDLDEGRGETR
jgi:hypothetical protein